MSAFMAQSGTLIVCGNAGEALGDSLYETEIYVKGSVPGSKNSTVLIKKISKHINRSTTIEKIAAMQKASANVKETKKTVKKDKKVERTTVLATLFTIFLDEYISAIK